MNRGAWRATVHGVAKSWTRLNNFTSLHFKEDMSLKKKAEKRRTPEYNNVNSLHTLFAVKMIGSLKMMLKVFFSTL